VLKSFIGDFPSVNASVERTESLIFYELMPSVFYGEEA